MSPPDDGAWVPDDDDAPDAPPTSPARGGMSIGEVIGGWRSAGPLVHEPTGIRRLDELTGGGPVYGTRWFIPGAPDAGKTLLLAHLAHTWAERGVTTGILAVDEEPGDIVTRLAQRLGYQRVDCEVRERPTLDRIASELEHLPIRLYDDTWTIEAAAADLAARATRGALLVDSIQTARCEADLAASLAGRDLSEVAAVTARVRALRAVSTRHHLIAIATSEQGRGAYARSDPDQQTSPLASAKWSGAVEYSARVLLALTSVAGESDLVLLTPAKNKHGPTRDANGDPIGIYLRIDRRSQTLVETDYSPAPTASRGERQTDRLRGVVRTDAVHVIRALLERPGLSGRALEDAVRAAATCGSTRARTAIAHLGAAVARAEGPRRSEAHYLDGSRLPTGMVEMLDPVARQIALAARPPTPVRPSATECDQSHP